MQGRCSARSEVTAEETGGNMQTTKPAVIVADSIGQAEYHDLDFVAGTGIEDADMTKALKGQRKIDKDMWR